MADINRTISSSFLNISTATESMAFHQMVGFSQTVDVIIASVGIIGNFTVFFF